MISSIILVIFVFNAVVDCKIVENEFPNIDEENIDMNIRIVGGEDAKEGQFPYQVALRFKSNHLHFCGGSILSSRFILTAAHCSQYEYKEPTSIYAVLGAINRTEGGIIMFIDKVTPHPSFSDETTKNDISLLRTAQEIIFTNHIQPIALPTHNLPINTAAYISGWGIFHYPKLGNPLFPEILQFSLTHTISNKSCLKRIRAHPQGTYIGIFNQHICTINDSGTGFCSGDSGEIQNIIAIMINCNNNIYVTLLFV